MRAQIQKLLDAIAGNTVSLTSARGAGRAFELLLMTEIATELKSRSYQVRLLRSDGQIQKSGLGSYTFVQRGGAPAGIAPAPAGPSGPTTIAFRGMKGMSEWEIWNGVQFVGRSGGYHEFDISIVPKSLGDALRAVGGRPFGHGWVSVECKDVQATGSPDEMRAFVARAYDTTLLDSHAKYLGAIGSLRRIHPNVPTQPGYGQIGGSYRQENQAVYFGIARRTGFSKGTRPISNYFFIRRFENIGVATSELADLKIKVCDWIDLNLPSVI